MESFLTCVTHSPSTTVSITAKQKETIDMTAVSFLALEIVVSVRNEKAQIWIALMIKIHDFFLEPKIGIESAIIP